MDKVIPSQKDHDPKKPEEHFLWALRNMPMFAGSGFVTHSGFMRKWSQHLWDCGFVHRDYLVGLADKNGKIPVGKLPKQTIKFQEAFRGPHHSYNNAARWVGVDTADPVPMSIPNIRDLTLQEQHALLYQFQQAGMVPDGAAQPPLGGVEEEPDGSEA